MPPTSPTILETILTNHKNPRQNSNQKSIPRLSVLASLISLQGDRRSKIFENTLVPSPRRIIFSNRWSSCRWSTDIRQAYRPVRIFKSNYTGEAHASSIDRRRDERVREKVSLVSLAIDHRTGGHRSFGNQSDRSVEGGGRDPEGMGENRGRGVTRSRNV